LVPGSSFCGVPTIVSRRPSLKSAAIMLGLTQVLDSPRSSQSSELSELSRWLQWQASRGLLLAGEGGVEAGDGAWVTSAVLELSLVEGRSALVSLDDANACMIVGAATMIVAHVVLKTWLY
jgi:hypothetical protein